MTNLPKYGVDCRECHTSLTILYNDPDKDKDWIRAHLIDLVYYHLTLRHPNSAIVKAQDKSKIDLWIQTLQPPPPDYQTSE